VSQFHIDEAHKLLRREPCNKYKGDVFFIQGRLFYETDRLDSAVVYYQKALDISKSTSDKSRTGEIYLSMGRVHGKMGNVDRAISWLHKSRRLALKIKDYELLVNGYSILSTAYHAKGRVNPNYNDSAFIVLDKAFETTRKHKLDYLKSSLHYKYAGTLMQSGKLEEAKPFIDSSIYLSRKYKQYPQLNSSIYRLSEYYLAQQKYDAALQALDSCLFYSRKINTSISIGTTYEAKYLVYKQKGDFVNALHALEVMRAYHDSVNLEKQNTTIRELEGKYDQLINEKKIDDLHHQNSLVKAQNKVQVYWIISIVVVALLFLGITYFVYRQILRKNKMRIIATEQRLNRARMDPHFIFNAIAAIQMLTLEDERKEEVGLFLSKFSKIMRLSLESTFHETVSLESEISFLQDYLTVQKLLKGNFEFKINCAPEVDMLSPIPCMLLQPIVENAIEHGLKNLEKEGQLQISITQEDDKLKIYVRDNGLGPVSADKEKKYPSRSTEILRDRLFLIEKVFRREATYSLKKSQADNYTEALLILPLSYENSRR
jgi:tetratricopeptide (TPR) repeat protein